MRVTAQDDPVEALKWANDRLGEDDWWPADTVSLSVLDDAGARRAVVVFNYFQGSQACIHIASDGSKAWLTRDVLFTIFGWAFFEMKLTRLSGYIAASNGPSLRLAFGLGFVPEGRLRAAAPDGGDMMVNGMLRTECRWLKRGDHGQG